MEEENKKEETKNEEEIKKEFNPKAFAIILIIAIIAIVTGIYFLISSTFEKNKKGDTTLSNSTSAITQNKTEVIQAETKEVAKENEYAVKDNNLSKFDLSFLKFENEEENMIYSPLSIKYAFKMLEEGTTGEARDQIASIIEAYNLTEYTSNEKMALANAFFIRDTFKDSVKESYINALKTKYNADIEFDDFSSAERLNFWVNEHTLNLIPEIMSDDDVGELDFALVNALGIDMEWKDKFIHRDKNGWFTDYEPIEFSHEKRVENPETNEDNWAKRWISVHFKEDVVRNDFEGLDTDAIGMHIEATINNYDIVNELGEENIKQIVSEEYGKFARNEDYDSEHAMGDVPLSEDTSDEGIQLALDKWLPNYIEEINGNYHKVGYSTDFSIYVNDDVKVFAKDLEDVDGTTLQYIGIMPTRESLESFIENIDATTINRYITSLKTLEYQNFKEGVVTRIIGFIPKFNFEYDLNLKEDLNKMGVTDVFEQGKASLTKLTDNESVYIGTAKHKANIEFTEDGIKAAAATMVGGLGGGEPFDYFFDVPVEDIDMTFNKPYMFLIRDKQTSETWFVGTVYEPLEADEKTERLY